MEKRWWSLVAVLVLLSQSVSLHAAAAPVFVRVDRHGDPLPEGALARLGTVRLRHALTWGSAHCQLIFSPDGKVLLSRGQTGIRVWDVDTDRALDWMPQGPGFVAARLLPDGKTLVTVKMERRPRKFEPTRLVQRWRWGTGALLGQEALPSEATRPGMASSLGLLSRDGKLLVRWGYSGMPAVWNTQTCRKLYQLDRAAAGVRVLAFTPDGKQLVLVAGDGGAHVYDTATGKHVRELAAAGPRPSFAVPTYAFPQVSPEGQFLVLSLAQDLHLWDLRSGKGLARCDGVRGPVSFSADGKWLACSAHRAIHLLEARTLKVVRTFEPHHEMRGTYALAFSPDGKRLALGGEHAIALWDVATGKKLVHPAGHLSVVRSLAFSPDGKRLASGGQDGTALVWDLATSQPVHAFRGHYFTVAGLAFSPDGRSLATGDGTPSGTNNYEAQVRLYDLTAGKLVRQFHGHLNGVVALRFSPDGKTLATGGGDDRVRLWDVASGRRLGQVRHLRFSRPASFLDGGKSLLIYQRDGGWRVLDALSLRSLKAFEGGDRTHDSHGAFCLPGEKQVVVLVGNEVIWYDRAKAQPVRKLNVTVGRLAHGLVLSPDATVVACSDRNGAIELWDVLDGYRFATLKGHTKLLMTLAFSPDGRLLASAGHDTTVLVWDVERARLEHQLAELLAGRGDLARLAADPRQAVAVLVARLRQSATAERRALSLIRDLDNDDFAVREKASEKLAKLGAEAAFALQRAVKESPSLEVKTRARRLLAKIAPKDLKSVFSPDQVRRAVGLLVKLGPPARRALEELAELDRQTLVGQETRRALAELRGKGPRR